MFVGLGPFCTHLELDLIVDAVLDSKLLLVKVRVDFSMQGGDNSVRECLVALFLTILLATA